MANFCAEFAKTLEWNALKDGSYDTRPKFTPRKRNSELINSLLGLPKNMNDAGKR